MHCAASSFQNSLNSFDCFSGACIMVLIETKGIYVTHCLLPFFAELQQSDFVLREKRKFLENKPGIELNMNIELKYINKCKSGIDHSRPDPYTLAFEPWRLTQHMVTHWEPPGLEPCHRSTPLTG